MSLADWWRGTASEAVPMVNEGAPTVDEAAELRAELADARGRLELVSEAAIDAAMAMDTAGWARFRDDDNTALNRLQLERRVHQARLLARVNPLLRRGLALRHGYVWGQGVTVAALASGGSDGQQDVDAVVQAFLDDEGVQRVLTGAQAREELERQLGTDGNVFFALFTSPLTGLVQPRPVPFDQIVDIITDPDDASEHWFYRREWDIVVPSPVVAGGSDVSRRVELYPALGYTPARGGMTTYNGLPVVWDAPMVALQVNRPHVTAKWGLPDAYAAVEWSKMYDQFLRDWSKLVESLSKIAWRATASDPQRRKAQQEMQRALQGTPHWTGAQAGGAAVMSPDVTLEAVPKTGATIDSGSGRPVAAMVASALDVPVTMLLGDPGVTGARATAETLDRPTEQMAMGRREVWSAFYRKVCTHVIREAVRARRGPLRGQIVVDDWGREQLVLAGDTDPTVSVTWPDLTGTPVQLLVQSIVQAESTDKLPPLLVARLLMAALGVEDVDQWLDELTDPDTGEFRDPGVTAGQAAADAFRRGQDPAALLAGNPADLTAGQGDATA